MSTALCAALSILSAPVPACSLLGEEDWLPATTATAAAPNMATESNKVIRFRFLAFRMVITILRTEWIFSQLEYSFDVLIEFLTSLAAG
jgi:hypothetical protein